MNRLFKLKNLKFIFLFCLFILNSDLTAITHKKSIPKKIRAVWTHKPSSSISLLWDAGFGKVWDDILYYDTVDFGSENNKYRYRVSPEKYTRYKRMKTALVRLQDLAPSTKYYFLIKNTFGFTRRFWFKTASSARNSKISFIAGGDSRNNRVPRINANILVSKLRSMFVLFGGDMTDRGTKKQWKRWLNDWQASISKDGRITPLIIVRGNHEASNNILTKLFDMPKTGYYSMSFANKLLKVYVLNSEISISGKQSKWLLEDMKSNRDYDFSTAIYHRPMRPHASSKKEGVKQYKYWSRPFYKYGMDLVIESDSHTVKSTYPVIPSASFDDNEGFLRNDKLGTVYVGEGCWGAPLRRADDRKSWTRSSGSFNQFKLIFVDSHKMQIRTIITDNAKEVYPVNGTDVYDIPENLNVWTPEEGAVILIRKKNKL